MRVSILLLGADEEALHDDRETGRCCPPALSLRGGVVKVTVAMLVAVLGLGVCTVPLVTDAQQTGNVYHVGYLTVRSDGSREQLFEQALRERGWRLGEDVVITYRGAEGN
jgi:hypothetical protein